ncbi:STAS domain-containing protein [Streptomyces sp. SP18CS02]|uniref:STAS domain-containing protein n=1 Tax=Streptomyces sp. SP18CS02 TaxID=3002531 RepID=UPI002E766530|nr:STAS domain-containing protein [Streptomyces sp. SP18CS02]MEE1757031.1 STAS domain-containing protein [Streptomyces sp. SP18CS02]
MLSNDNSRFYRGPVRPTHPADQTLRITEDDESGVRVVAVSGEADLENVGPLDDLLREAADGSGRLVLDLSGLAFADSTMVNVILRAYTDLGERLRIAAPSEFMRRLFDLTGLDSVLPLYDGVAEALAAGTVPPVADVAD